MATRRSYVEPWRKTAEEIRGIITTRKAMQAQDASVKRDRPMYRTLVDQRAREGLRRVAGCKDALLSGDYVFYLRHCTEMPALTLDELVGMIRSAARDNKTDVIDRLLTLSGVDHNGASVFYIAHLARGVTPAGALWGPAGYAFGSMGYTHLLLLLEALHGEDENSYGIYEPALAGAARAGHLDTVQFILENKLDTPELRAQARALAVEGGHLI